VLPLKCVQAWVKSNKSYSGMLSILETLARVSLANRNLTFPNTREAGSEAGKGIAQDCTSDPNARSSQSSTGMFVRSPKRPRMRTSNANAEPS